MQINKFIKTVFPTEETIEIPKTIETKKLEKTWKKVITGLEKDYGPKTKLAESKVERLKKDEERIDNEKLNIQRQKIQADNDLKQSKEEDKKILEKIIGKYQGDKLAKEIGRLNELPIESLILVGGKKLKKKSRDELIVRPGVEWVTEHPVVHTNNGVDEEVEREVDSDGFDEVSDIQETPLTNHVHSGTSINAGSINNDYFAYTLGNEISVTTRLRSNDDEPALTQEVKAKKLNKDLPYLVIFTKPLKTEKPDDEELKRYHGISKLSVKSLGNKDIGRFIIIINLADMSRYGGLKAFNLDLVADEHYDHACVSSGSVCLGSRADTYDKLAKNYQIFDMVDLVLDLLVSTTVSGPYIDWRQWFQRATKPTTSFTNKRITNFFKGKGEDSIGSMVNGAISNSGYTTSVFATPSDIPREASRDPMAAYQGWDPAVADTDNSRRQMIEMEMRRHLEQTREAMERQRNDYSRLQSQMYDPSQMYGGGAGSSGLSSMSGGGSGGGAQTISNNAVDVSSEISALNRLIGRH